MNYKLKIEIEEYRGRLEALKICQYCRWWKSNGKYGLCRKRAPINAEPIWPTTYIQDNCGEHIWSNTLHRLSINRGNYKCIICKNEFSYFDFIWGDPCPICNLKLLGETLDEIK